MDTTTVAALRQGHRRPTRVLTEPSAWLVVPLRLFLGITFIYAGLQKLADRWFFRSSAPSSVQSQLHGAARTSPIGGVVGGAAHYAVLLGLLIALGELAIGLGTLLGLWGRLAAAGGLLISLAFLLTVSWHSRPYYYGADIVFVFAWTPLLIGGAGRISFDAAATRGARASLGMPPLVPVTVGFDIVQRLCGFYGDGRCSAQRGRPCAPPGCPVLARPESTPTAEVDRRAFLARAGVAGWVAAGAVTTGAVAAIAGRLIGPRAGRSTPVLGRVGSSSTTSPPESPTAPPPTASSTAGTAIGPASAIPVGSAAAFTDPATGDPAYVVQPTRGRFVAFDATCTHAGCPVEFAGAEFRCPCHGAIFNSTTGAVQRGPARRPLAAIRVVAGPDGQLYVQPS